MKEREREGYGGGEWQGERERYKGVKWRESGERECVCERERDR